MKKVIIKRTGIAEPHMPVTRKYFVVIAELFRRLDEQIVKRDKYKELRENSFAGHRIKFFRRVGLFGRIKSINNNNIFHQRSCLAIGLTDGVV